MLCCLPVLHAEQCGGALRALGQDISETLEYVPGRFKVIRTVRPKTVLPVAVRPFIRFAAPSMPIERGRPCPGLSGACAGQQIR